MFVEYEEYITGEKFQAAFGWCYCKTDDVVATMGEASYILTHNSDWPVTEEMVSKFPDIMTWIGQNICCERWPLTNQVEVHPIPIGLENDYNGGAKQRKRYLYELSRQNLPEATSLCYHNCGTSHPDRRLAAERFRFESWCTKASGAPFADYCSHLIGHHFIICPRGNGL